MHEYTPNPSLIQAIPAPSATSTSTARGAGDSSTSPDHASTFAALPSAPTEPATPLSDVLSGILARLHSVRQTGPDQWRALCPAHDDHNPSLNIVRDEDGRVRLHCFAGCSVDAICKAFRVTPADLLPAYADVQAAAAAIGKRLKATRFFAYTYTDAAGQSAFFVIRFESVNKEKTFRPLHPVDGRLRVGDPAGRLPLYRLTKLAGHERVYVVEGEKCADAAFSVGLVATTSAHGANAPQRSDWVALAGHDVVILPDNDAAGQKYAASVAALARKAGAKRIRIVQLPGLPDGGDIVEFVAARSTRPPDEIWAEIETLVEAAPDVAPADAPMALVTPANGLPMISTAGRRLSDITNDALHALIQADTPPVLFVHAGRPARVRVDGDRPHIEALTADAIRGHLDRVANWTAGTREPHVVFPPPDVVRDLLALDGWDFPRLEGIVEVPTFAADGTLQLEPGYGAPTLLFYSPTHRPLPEIPYKPSPTDICAARDLLRSELLGDFPFVDEASAATALAAMLLPFVRQLISGPTPLHALDAPTAGTGKTLLAEIVCIPALEQPPPMMSPASSDDEWRKRITAALRTGASVQLIDNVRQPLDSAALAAALTARTWSDRELGRSRMLSLPARCLWLATGNNLAFSREIARRSVMCRIDARTDAPECRGEFRHPDLRRWAREHRSRLIAALLTLVQAWITAGQPAGSAAPLGSFEHWTTVIGGILDVADVPGFMQGRASVVDAVDDETQEWRRFVSAWHVEFRSAAVGTAELMEKVLRPQPDLLATTLGSAPTDQGRRTKLGQELKRRRDNVVGDWIITVAAPDRHACQRYQLVPAESRQSAGGGAGTCNIRSDKELRQDADSADSSSTPTREANCSGEGSTASTSVEPPAREESAEPAISSNSLSPQDLAAADFSADSSLPPVPHVPAPLPGNDEAW